MPRENKPRALKTGEKNILKQVFKSTLPTDRILLCHTIGLGGAMYTMPMLLTNKYHIHVGPDYFKGDMSAKEAGQFMLVHESMHVWQGIHGFFEWDYILNSVACQIVVPIVTDHTAYTFEVGKEWKKYNAEQQADIVAFWYAQGMLSNSPMFRYIRDNVRTAKKFT